ncbi:metal ABC transporter solute-binding protein, Zn/Mn family [Endozoicomonas sp. ONNA1]|uniref:metal ABC transporter substrate-binding protein n=3 Tax=unclassified Endozoicomonas TaxID=2644528 RepID=UPI0021472D8C|nr:zinc ABC transporter substrate-binding protein [Endozoicomonas sp. ONNA1]
MRILSKLLLAFALAFPVSSHGALTVFACEPEWAALSEAIAPEAKVYTATTARQDPHHIQARPGLISKMRKADIVVCSGAELETGWLPVLQMKSANPKVQTGDKGLFFAADQVETIGKLEKVDPTMGDVHPEGNPHLHLDPYRVEKVTRALAERMAELDPGNRDQYKANAKKFSERWEANIERWEKVAAPLKGKNLVTYHSNFDYLLEWLGVNVVGDLEPKPGLPPSSRHLASLLELSKKTSIDAIIFASYQDKKGADWLSQRAGVPAKELPMTIGGSEQSVDLISLYDDLIQKLLKVTGSPDNS